jgi:hypothetical protein
MARMYLPPSVPPEPEEEAAVESPASGGVVEVQEPAPPGPTVTEPVKNPEPPAVPEPSRGGSKADWVIYAVSKGADQAAAEAMSRDELAKQYGTPV